VEICRKFKDEHLSEKFLAKMVFSPSAAEVEHLVNVERLDGGREPVGGGHRVGTASWTRCYKDFITQDHQ
jgi:hypothetical protein